MLTCQWEWGQGLKEQDLVSKSKQTSEAKQQRGEILSFSFFSVLGCFQVIDEALEYSCNINSLEILEICLYLAYRMEIHNLHSGVPFNVFERKWYGAIL